MFCWNYDTRFLLVREKIAILEMNVGWETDTAAILYIWSSSKTTAGSAINYECQKVIKKQDVALAPKKGREHLPSFNAVLNCNTTKTSRQSDEGEPENHPT